jgi:hypothetical protein
VWELPFSRALKYYHAILRSEGVWTIRPIPIAPVNLENLRGFFDTSPDDEDEFL